MTIIRPATINARFSQPVGLGGEKLWLCPTLGGDRLDLSGNGNHGTYYGGMGIVADKYKGDRAFDLDGVDDYIRTDLKGIRNYESRTVSLWSNLNSVAGAQYFCNWYDDAGGTDPRSLFFLIYQSKHTAGHKLGGGSNATILFQGGVPSVGWKHYAFTYDKDSTNAKIYVDGISVANANISNTAWEADFSEIGRVSIPSVTDYTQQRCDDIRFFDRALTPSEIKHLASYRGVLGSPRQPYDPFKQTVVRVTALPVETPAATKVGSIKKPTTIIKPSYQSGYARNASESENPKLWDGLVGAWIPSLGVTGETLRDVSGNGNHGVLTNMDAATDWVATSKGLALDFGGSPNYVNFSSIDLKLNPDAISFVFWFKGSDPRSVLRIQSLNQNSPYIVPIWSTNYSFIQSNIGTVGAPSSPTELRDGNWHHCAAVYDRNKFYGYYLDGKVSNNNTNYSLPLPTNFTSTQMFRWWGDLEYSVGKFASGSIYNRALSPTEIKQLYVDSLAPFRKKQRLSVAFPTAIPPVEPPIEPPVVPPIPVPPVSPPPATETPQLPDSGQILYEDEYKTQYDIKWTTVNDTLDITTITSMPYVWGEQPTGKVENKTVYRQGIVTVERQALRRLEDGYIIVAEGASQYTDFIKTNQHSKALQSDPFKHHLNYMVQDQIQEKVTQGPHWADPDDPDDADAIWGDLNTDGSPIEDLTGTGGLDILSWVDVWDN